MPRTAFHMRRLSINDTCVSCGNVIKATEERWESGFSLKGNGEFSTKRTVRCAPCFEWLKSISAGIDAEHLKEKSIEFDVLRRQVVRPMACVIGEHRGSNTSKDTAAGQRKSDGPRVYVSSGVERGASAFLVSRSKQGL